MTRDADGDAWGEGVGDLTAAGIGGLMVAGSALGPSEMRAQYPEVDAFADEMRYELWINRRKGNRAVWQTRTPEFLMNEVHQHVAKLVFAVRKGDPGLIREHAADVANTVMAVRDVLGERPL